MVFNTVGFPAPVGPMRKNKLPFGIGAGLTGFYQSGYPYTPMIFNGDKPQSDVKNKNTKKSNALDYVFGYTCANDVSARDWQ